MRSKVFFAVPLLMIVAIIYGWKCSSIKKIGHTNKAKQSDSAPVATFVPGSSSASIDISSARAVPFYRDIHSACTADIFFSRGMRTREVLNQSYLSFIKSFNFTSLQYSGGSTADHDHAIVGDTRISGGKGDGYNINPADLKMRGEDINGILDGVGNVRFGVDFFNEYSALLTKLNIPGDLIANVQAGTVDELIWKIQQAHAQRVIFGMEQNLPGNSFDFPDGKAYEAKITKWIMAVKQKFPGITIAVDAAPVYKSNSRYIEWNDAIRNMPADEVRLYLWDKDGTVWSADQNENLARMNRLFTETFPHWFDREKELFPGKKVSIWQWGLKSKSNLFNTMGACIYIGKFYEFMINYNRVNNNYIGYAAFMSLKSLDRGDGYVLNHALPLQACGKLFSGEKRVMDLSIKGSQGLSGVALESVGQTDGKYMLLLINESGNELSIPALTIDNAPYSSKKFSVTSVHAANLASTDVSMTTQTTASLSLPPFSVNIVEF